VKVSLDAERSTRGGHADRFWIVALASQKERGPAPSHTAEIGVRVIGWSVNDPGGPPVLTNDCRSVY